jgi:membrane-associated phospholipid phosphatase
LKPALILKVVVRLAALAGGFAVVSGLVYAAGLWLVPLTDGADKAILAACNPDSYAPGLDQFFRAVSDYSNFLILLPFLSWTLATLIYTLLPKLKIFVAGLLAAETVTFAVLAAMGKIWPNKTYVGVNVLLVLAILAAFGLAAYLFYRLDRSAIRRLTGVFGLMFFSGLLTDLGATSRIKEAVARPRPLNDAHKPWNEQVRIIPDEVLRGRNSYPSGHTTGTFSLLTPLFWYVRDRRGRAGLLGWATLQGMSRVYTAAHFPFCCLMGGLLGFTVGTLVFFMLGGPALRSKPEVQEAT